jgi:cytochrome c2
MMRGIAFLLMVLTLALTACGGGGGTSGGSSSGSSGGNADRGKTLMADKQCGTCHTLAAIPSFTGTIGPPLNGIGTTAGSRKPGMAADAYIRESIKDPNAFIVQGYPSPSPMILPVPVNDAEINDIVAFLVTQK